MNRVIAGFKTQMTQDVTVHVTTLEDILSHPNQSPATVVPVHGTLVFEISAYAIIDVRHLHEDPLPAEGQHDR